MSHGANLQGLTPQQILGVSETATRAEITKAYWAAMKQHHPDANGGVANGDVYRITEAYEKLKNQPSLPQFDEAEMATPGQPLYAVTSNPGRSQGGHDPYLVRLVISYTGTAPGFFGRVFGRDSRIFTLEDGTILSADQITKSYDPYFPGVVTSDPERVISQYFESQEWWAQSFDRQTELFAQLFPRAAKSLVAYALNSGNEKTYRDVANMVWESRSDEKLNPLISEATAAIGGIRNIPQRFFGNFHAPYWSGGRQESLTFLKKMARFFDLIPAHGSIHEQMSADQQVLMEGFRKLVSGQEKRFEVLYDDMQSPTGQFQANLARLKEDADRAASDYLSAKKSGQPRFVLLKAEEKADIALGKFNEMTRLKSEFERGYPVLKKMSREQVKDCSHLLSRPPVR